MSESLSFRRVPVRPVAAIQESYRRIRDQYWLFVAIAAAGLLIGSAAPLGLLIGPMMCGVFACYRDKWQGRRVRFEGVFDGFRAGVLGPALIAGLLTTVASFVVILPCVLVGLFAFVAGGASGAFDHGSRGAPVLFIVITAGAFLLLIIAAMLLSTLLAFTFPLIIDRHLPAVDAIKLSARAGIAHFGGLLGLALVGGILGLVGACLCYVGALLVLPITFGAQMIVYERVFGLSEPEIPATT